MVEISSSVETPPSHTPETGSLRGIRNAIFLSTSLLFYVGDQSAPHPHAHSVLIRKPEATVKLFRDHPGEVCLRDGELMLRIGEKEFVMTSWKIGSAYYTKSTTVCGLPVYEQISSIEANDKKFVLHVGDTIGKISIPLEEMQKVFVYAETDQTSPAPEIPYEMSIEDPKWKQTYDTALSSQNVIPKFVADYCNASPIPPSQGLVTIRLREVPPMPKDPYSPELAQRYR